MPESTKSTSDIQARLQSLTPEARARVEAALKSTLEQELATQAQTGGEFNPRAQFSRGILFSKSGASANFDEVILPAITSMDDEKFNALMDRIATLKARTPGGTP